MINADQLKANGVQATLNPSLVIETFEGDWEKEWFSDKPEAWPRSTHRLRDPQYASTISARLAVEVRSALPNTLVIKLDDYAAEVPKSPLA
jgi:hypothetical protein